jgi:CubicO group peptidase (beta-lactamase class C family)
MEARVTGLLPRSTRVARAIACAVVLVLAPIVPAAQTPPNAASTVDAVFATWTQTTPGCAVGVAVDGKPVLARGYGMADLEHDIAITPETIFEAGSVSKQFTAASILLLARDGKLTLDDPVRKYIPELPDYQAPGGLTIRHMLSHTSGLRDWGSVAAIAGWPRTTRVHTHAHVLEIVGRQKALNFQPGTRWSYSNTGFNLAAIIVERVGGMSFQEFTRMRLFGPLGMVHTSWRDDFTQIVKGRAMAYSSRNGVFHTEMPFENVFGNGGLLTTVGDLLKWNEHFDAVAEGDPLSTREQQQAGRFNDGRTHGYALGLFVGRYKGVREVYHSGSTAGYNAFLTRFPDAHVSVAVLCNATTAQAAQYAHAVSEAYLGDRLKRIDQTAAYTLTPDDAARIAGLYRSDETGLPVTIARAGDDLKADRVTLVPQSATRFSTAAGGVWEVDNRGLRRTDEYGTVEAFARVEAARPTPSQLDVYTGRYVSEEAETELRAVVDNGRLVLKRRPDTTIALTPIYSDAFGAGALGTVFFRRDAGGQVTALSLSQDRVWDLRFHKANGGE